MANLRRDDDDHQVMIVDSSMETADESSERNVPEAHERKAMRRYTIVNTTVAFHDIKVEDIVDGVVVGVNNYTKKTEISKSTETFEENASSTSPSFVSSSTSSHRFADVSGSSVEEGNFARSGIARSNVVTDINRALETYAHVEKVVSQRRPINVKNLLSLDAFSPVSSQAGSRPGEFPPLGSSPPGLEGEKDSSRESLFKFPSSQFHHGRYRRHEKSARFSSSTSVSEEDRRSTAGRSFIPADISSIRLSAGADPLPQEKASPDFDLHGDSPPRAECTSPSIIARQKSKGIDGQESEDLFSSSGERSFSLFPAATSKSETSGDSANVPEVGDSPGMADVIPPTESEASDKDKARAGLQRKMRRPKLPLRRYSVLRRMSTIVGSPSEVRPELSEEGRVVVKTLKHGTLVYTKWTDGHFYPGQVDRAVLRDDVGISGDDSEKFGVLFDDGHLYEANRCDIIVCDLLPMGSFVMADRSESDIPPQAGPSTPRGKRGRRSETAEVVGHFSKADGSKSYLVKFKDGKEVFAERRKVTLTLAQASRAFGSLVRSVDPHRSLRLSPDISTDNLVEGKRKRRPPTPLSQSDQWEFLTGSMTSPKRKKTKTMRRLKVVSSTPRVNKRKYTCIKKTRSEPYDPCPPVIIHSPTTHHRSISSKKSVKRALSYTSGPKSSIFRGLTFLVTHVWKSPSQLEKERALAEGEAFSTSCYTSSPEVPPDDPGIRLMNRDLVVDLIREGGGTILEEFDLEAVSKVRKTCYLVSDSPQRTIKYLCCLAFGVPCVSYQWIVCSSNQNKLENYSLYLLPIGYSIEKNLILTKDHHRDRRSPLEGIRVLLRLQGGAETTVAWKKVLVAAGCRVVVVGAAEALADQVKLSMPKTYLVTDSGIHGDKDVDALNRGAVTLVSTEWVVQCIINEKIVDPDQCPKYRP